MNPLTDPLPPGPEHLGFILSRKCTARCGICYVRNEADIARGARRGDALPLFGSNDMPPGDMDPSLFSRILAAYPTVVGTDIAAIGETFDYPNFDEVFVRAYAFMPRIRSIGVTSNGGKLDLHMKIMAVPGFVTISVDSPDPAHCDVLRPGTDGARVWRNVSAAAALQQVRAVGINMILSRRNAHEIGAMADRLAPIGVKYLTVLRAIHLSGDVADDEMRFDEPGPRQAILAARAAHPGMVIADHFTYFDGGPTTSPAGSNRCAWPFSGLIVDANGHGRLCCRIQGQDLGDMLTDAPWTSAAMQRLRAQALACSWTEEFAACTTCHCRYGGGTAHLS